jgi:butyryl-CoA dehydrogenase
MSNNTPIVNRRDLDFLVFDWLQAEHLCTRPRHVEHSRATFCAALDTAEALARERFAPLNRLCDELEPHFDGERVHLPPEVGQALRAYCDAGLLAASHDFDRGGMQLPTLVAQACGSLFKSANIAISSYAGLTQGNANVILRFGTEAQRQRYLPHLLSGRFMGTMALTEPQAGSSLADIRTTATPLEGGQYAVKGQKIFISAGDHALSENIVHLVLARLPDAPPGVKGISLFIVPKFRVQEDGSLGPHNDVNLAGLIHKMGWRGTTSTMLSFGERDACHGELIGPPHQGLACMFQMMNEARIGVGMGAAMLGYRGYLAALDYARDRPQGRLPDSKNPQEPQRQLIEHADVRRMLLAQKAYVEGGYALCLYAARLVDDQHTHPDEALRHEAALLLDVLTPIVKSWPSQWCLAANDLAIQVHGGYGYTREYPVEQFYRDNRLNPIHEGTHGIQAMDLLGRKMMMQQGAGMAVLAQRMSQTIEATQDDPTLREMAEALRLALADLHATLAVLRPVLAADPVRGLANAAVFLEACGHTVLAWLWLEQARVAAQALGAIPHPDEAAFLQGKLQACRYFCRWELPRTQAQYALLRTLDGTPLDMEAGWF